MLLRSIIVDNEHIARQHLHRLLLAVPGIDIVAECEDGPTALKALEQSRVDLLLLNIRMPGMNGFEVVERIESRPLPLIIFVTGYEQYAVRAFDTRAVDFLLKPVSAERLHHAINRVRRNLRLIRAMPRPTSQADTCPSRRFSVRRGSQISFVAPEEIDWIESAGNYAVLHVGNQNHLLRETMSSLERELPGDSFMRVSRSAIVHLSRVKELETIAEGHHCAVLDNGARVAMTRSVREVEQRLRATPMLESALS
jgi:two-component system LytT family response regulator